MRQIGRACAVIAIVAFAASWMVARVTSTAGRQDLPVRRSASASAGVPRSEDGTLAFCTFNLAHARTSGWWTMLEGPGVVESVLTDVGAVLLREGVDVCALQEVDGPSWWSHHLNQGDGLRDRAEFGYSAHSYHVDGLGVAYGTAVLSRPEIVAAERVTFETTEPTFSKGFTLVTIRWPGDGREVDVVSAHIDFSRPWTRTAQQRRLRDTLRDRGRPLVLMGDFNTSWDGWFAKVKWLAGALSLSAYQPERVDEAMITMPTLGWRIDWILISEELRFESYRVLPDALSDHRFVVARIGLK